MNPYAIAPTLQKVKQTYVGRVVKDSVTGHWLAPFLMASINTKVVFRTAMQLPALYPEGFRYNEAMAMGSDSKGKKRAKNIARGLAAITIGSAIAPLRWLMQKFLLPKPGQGPTEQQQIDGYYTIQHYGKTATGEKLAIEVHGDQDPGYGSTAKMLTQAAVTLAQDLPESQSGGFWTPATIMGETLMPRLEKHAGIRFKVLNS
jgi:short subunit dehydrogenase-like uncharacterized protein